MSALAKKIDESTAPGPSATRRGPANACFPIYGAGDLEDWEKVEALRVTPEGEQKREWRDVQTYIDGLVQVAKPLTLEKFKYHWRRRCYCWPEDLRR